MSILERDFDYTSLTYGQRLGVHNALADVTKKHVGLSNGLLELLDFDPATYHSQLLETVHLEPVPATFEDVPGPDGTLSIRNLGIISLATAAGPDLFPHIQATYARQRPLMSVIRRLLFEHHDNITVLSAPHQKLPDIALEASGWAFALRDEPRWQEHNGIGISRGITTLGAFDGTPAPQELQKIGHVYLSFPRTETFKKMAEQYKREAKHSKHPLDIDRLIDTNNRRLQAEVAEWSGTKLSLTGYHPKGVALHLAEEGKSTPVTYDEDGKIKSIELGSVADGTIRMVEHGLVLPVTVWDGSEPIFEIGELTKVKSQGDMNRVRNWQRETLARCLGLKLEQVSLA